MDGRCTCVPRCDGRQCGPDGCGGTCGSCGSGSNCSESGACVCVPQCQGKSCGPDGCGGSCGTCPSNSTCTASGETCGCDAGYVPDAASEACVRIGGPCQGVSEYGHCVGDSWVRCDAQAGVVVVPCGAGQCKTVDSQGTGACRCGSIDANGVCASADGTSTARPNTHFVCATSLGILMAENCGARTGSSAGLCSTFVTSAGHVTSCFCDTCTIGTGGACRPLCSNPNACRYYSAGNFHTCGF
ncbi:hypothetical protein [Myxococcus faecalis]|uniref:hypothetical protein n=1 Tax=Myxococcus faecalis TaxID=3115646 RepID=UPI003CFA7E59